MDVNWKMEEALMAVRDGVQLSAAQQTRMEMAESRTTPPGRLRRTAASALLTLARRLDPETGQTMPMTFAGGPEAAGATGS